MRVTLGRAVALLSWVPMLIAAAPAERSASPLSDRAEDYGRRLFERLAGGPLLVNDPRYADYVGKIAKKDLKGAAEIATADDGFYSVTIRDWAAVMLNNDGTPMIDFDDFQAMIIGVARDDLDARTLLTGDFSYRAPTSAGLSEPSLASNDHYLGIDANGLNLRSTLVRVEPQWSGATPAIEAAGLLTSRGWGSRQYMAGTNRRGVAFSFATFLCSPIATWKNAALSDFHVHRDVSRVPGGDPNTYQTTCRACHAPMDGFVGAFAHFDFDPNFQTLKFLGSGIAPKYNQNASTYPGGWVTTDDSWVNMIQDNPEFGWRTPAEGHGVKEFGQMLANSAQYSRCMARRSFKTVCRRDATATEQDVLKGLADRFEAGGYKIKSLFEDVAITPECLGTP